MRVGVKVKVMIMMMMRGAFPQTDKETTVATTKVKEEKRAHHQIIIIREKRKAEAEKIENVNIVAEGKRRKVENILHRLQRVPPRVIAMKVHLVTTVK